MGNSQQVAPPGEKPARRRAIPPALRGEYFPPFPLLRETPRADPHAGCGVAGEGDLPGYPIRPLVSPARAHSFGSTISPADMVLP